MSDKKGVRSSGRAYALQLLYARDGDPATDVAGAAAQSDIPVSFGVLTTDTIEQALERAGTKAGNKGFDAAISSSISLPRVVAASTSSRANSCACGSISSSNMSAQLTAAPVTSVSGSPSRA